MHYSTPPQGGVFSSYIFRMTNQIEIARALAREPIKRPYNRFPFVLNKIAPTSGGFGETHYCQTMAIVLNKLLLGEGISARICLAEKTGVQQNRWHPVNVFTVANEWFALDPSLGVLDPQKVSENSAFLVGSNRERYGVIQDDTGRWIDISNRDPLDIRQHNYPGDMYTQLWQRDLDGKIVALLRFIHPSKSIPEGAWKCTSDYNLYSYEGSLPPTAGPIFSALSTTTGIDPASLTAQLWTLHDNRHQIIPTQQQTQES
jgi:hypothetical protein